MVFALFIQQEIGSAGVGIKIPKLFWSVKYQEAHDMFGHLGKQATKDVIEHLGWKLLDAGGICESCAVGKAKQAGVPQVSFKPELKDGER